MNEQERVTEFIEAHGLGGGASTWVHDMQSELGEVAKEVLKASEYGSQEPVFDDGIADEVGDLYFSLLGLADALGIDLSAALDEALAKYADRLEATGSAGSGE